MTAKKTTNTVARSAGVKPKPRPSLRATRTNKHGQALGRKGNETKARLMDAARRLLIDQSPIELTAVSVAKEAGTSSATFYIYFDDIREILLALSEDAGTGLAEVNRILEEDWEPGTYDFDHALKVVKTFNAVWDRHRNILRFRNLEADRGDRGFLDLRIRASIRIIDRFVDRIIAASPRDQRPARGDAYAEATVLYAGMEGMAATDPDVVEHWQIGSERLAGAAAMLLARSFAAPSAVRPGGIEKPLEEPVESPSPSPSPSPAKRARGKARGT